MKLPVFFLLGGMFALAMAIGAEIRQQRAATLDGACADPDSLTCASAHIDEARRIVERMEAERAARGVELKQAQGYVTKISAGRAV